MLTGKTAGSPTLARAMATALTALWFVPAAAGEFVLSLGADDVFRSETTAALGAAFSGTLWHLGSVDVGLGMAGEIDGDGDVWGGAGVVATLPLDAGWRLEGSFMPGAYSEGSGGNDLGATFPMFRTQVGASLLLASGWRVGAAINHKSNAGTASYNPGVETVFLTFAREF